MLGGNSCSYSQLCEGSAEKETCMPSRWPVGCLPCHVRQDGPAIQPRALTQAGCNGLLSCEMATAARRSATATVVVRLVALWDPVFVVGWCAAATGPGAPQSPLPDRQFAAAAAPTVGGAGPPTGTLGGPRSAERRANSFVPFIALLGVVVCLPLRHSLPVR